MSVVEVSVDYGGRLLTLQTGKIARQADASVWAKYGDTVVLVSVVSAHKAAASQDFFPLTVDFQEKYYSAGRIPGGFFKREAKPSDRATLSARCIDRPIRPLFPDDYFYETFVTATVLSIDGVNEPDFVASIAASAALHMSDIPFNGPVGSCRVGYVNGEYVCNIVPSEAPNSLMDILVSGVRSGVVMVEGSSKEVSEKQLMDAIDFAHEKMQPILDLQDELRRKAGKPKREYDKPLRDEKLKAEMRTFLWKPFEKAFSVREKLARYEALDEVKKSATEKFGVAEPANDDDKAKNNLVKYYLEDLKAAFARELTLNTKKRIDGRGYSDIRDITCDVGVLPRVHGSGLFTRGETQVLAAVTLGTADDEQKIDSISGTYQKTFMLHYNFPPFSVGEARPLRPPGRREVGHGFLAERALSYIVPPKEKFPYTMRLVSEVLESNGSSSMATVCSGSLAMMDAGVPVEKACAGVAMGLIKEGNAVAVLSDILGDEDHLGDMDFKVCGTAEGITAFQMDLKIGGVDRIIMEQALEQAREGRLHVLSKMNEVLASPRTNISPYAPRIFTMKVRPDKVREVIGSGGKVIRSIIERTGVKIDIEDDGSINIASVDEASAQKAIEIINGIVEEAVPGKIYEGRVSRIADFGAFVEIIPGTDGLCHISELDLHRVRRVEDVVNVGDMIKVKCLEVDPSGKIRLSRRALLNQAEEEDSAEETEETNGHAPDAPAAAAKTTESDEENLDSELSPEDRSPREDMSLRPDASPAERMPRDRGPRGGGRGHSDRGGRGGMRGGRGGGRGGDRDRGHGGGRGRDRDRGGMEARGPRGGGDRDRGGDRGGERGGFGGGGDRDRGGRGGYSERGGYESRSSGGGGYDRGGSDRGAERGNERGGDRGGYRGGADRGERDGNRTFGGGGDRDRGGYRGGSDRSGGRGDDFGNRAPREDRGGRGGYGGGRGGGRSEGGWDRPSRHADDEGRGNRYRRDDDE